jgi:hypothetical protein
VQFDEVLEQPVDVIERVRALRVSRQLDRAPDLLVRRLRLDALELLLELLEVARHPRAA